MNQDHGSEIQDDGGKSQRYRKQAQKKIQASHDDPYGRKFTTTQLVRYYAPSCRGLGRGNRKLFCPRTGTAPEWEPPPHRFNSAEKSGVDPALPDGIGYTVDGQHVSRNAVINMMGLGITDHVLER